MHAPADIWGWLAKGLAGLVNMIAGLAKDGPLPTEADCDHVRSALWDLERAVSEMDAKRRQDRK